MQEFGLMGELVNLGAAGLMGVLWTWERMMSRQRERQLSESHERIVVERAEIAVLTDLVERNTAAAIRSAESHACLRRLLETALHHGETRDADIFETRRSHERDKKTEAA